MIKPRESAAEFRSFRDPAGRVMRNGGRILRTVHSSSVPEFEEFLSTPAARQMMDGGKLIRSVRVPGEEVGLAEDGSAVYEHERISFPSYPHEWPSEMLHAAGNLTIDLFRESLEAGFGLKDATPFNVLFRGPVPVFTDVLSFERREAKDATWMAYAQFVRTFLLPLMGDRYFGWRPYALFATNREGLEPENIYHWAVLGRRLTPLFFQLVTLPVWMSRWARSETYRKRTLPSADQANFVLGRVLRSCEKQLRQLEPSAKADSTWSGYLDHKSLYSAAQLAQKEAFVREALELARPRHVLDVGANEGYFSFLAARQDASVVAIDSDPVVTGKIWREASREGLDVLPLVMDLARPTPGLGWRNQECESFLDRAKALPGGGFDLVMMLAVIHHMMVTERVPLQELMDLVADLTTEYALIEFVAPADPMFERIVRGREEMYSHLTFAGFEAAALPHFEVVKSLKLDGLERCLYLLRRRHAAN